MCALSVHEGVGCVLQRDLRLCEVVVCFHVLWEEGEGREGGGDDAGPKREFEEGHGEVGVEKGVCGVVGYSGSCQNSTWII